VSDQASLTAVTVPTVTVRYWAGMRQAAGVETEQVAGQTLAEVLLAVRHRRDEAFARSLAVCSLVVSEKPVGTRDAESVTLVEGDVVEVLPPFAGGSHAAPAEPSQSRTPVLSGSNRGPAVVLAVLGALALVLAAQSGDAAVLLVAVLLQLPLLAGWHRGLGVSDPVGGMVVGAIVAVATDVAVWLDQVPASIAPVAAVVAASFLLGAVQQLARRDDRQFLLVSLAATTSLGALAAAMAAWPVLVRLADGDSVVTVAALAVAVSSLARLVGALPVAAVMVPGLGLITGLVLGGLLVGVTVPVGAAIGVAVSLPVLIADVLDRRDPRLVLGAWPAAAVWPFALAAPLAYLVVRVVAS
jgi:molybdopterin converting factor small subunit